MPGKRRTVLFALAVLAGMAGMVGVSVPLYRLMCRTTGLTGTPRKAEGPSHMSSGKTITIRFDASVMRDMPWGFKPDQTAITVHLGETTLAGFTARNLSDQPLTGTASFNVTPLKAAPYVDKIACFCFSEQRLGPGQTVEMPVTFYIDPKIAEDPNTDDVGTITLSYTFFKTRKQATISEGPS